MCCISKLGKGIKERSLGFKKNDIPRISGLTFLYHKTVYLLAKEYSDKKENEKLNDLINFYDKYLQIGFNNEVEKYYKNELEKLNK